MRPVSYRGVVAVSMVMMMMMTTMAKTARSNMKEGRHTATTTTRMLCLSEKSSPE